MRLRGFSDKCENFSIRPDQSASFRFAGVLRPDPLTPWSRPQFYFLRGLAVKLIFGVGCLLHLYAGMRAIAFYREHPCG